ncbi:MAG: LuxR C-terminal-related transcriptional regulator [Anaerolineales bacterium]
MTSVLLETKLRPPLVPPKRVLRELLTQRLNEGLDSGRQITLISAPAGFGKTVCASEWVNGLDYPFTWLSLDPADDDPGRFFTYFVAALQKVKSNIGLEIEGVLRAGQLPPSEILYTTLINDILEMDADFLLVLDDFQVIQDSFILQIFEQLVENLPQPLHLVLLTREDPSLPLARLRANNQLTEIRAADLRFSHPEADYFLNEVMDLSLSEEDIASLEERTEGWIVGLHLAGLSIRDRSAPSDFIASLSGSHRFILSYLTEEVLNQQPENIQQFLLQTSILDRLSGGLCNAVTGHSNSHSLLERLYHANLFIIPLDDEGHWYRYHQLFADLLHDLQETRLKSDITNLHIRASAWFAQRGMVSEAIQHALLAQDYTTAVQLIESHAMDMLMQWHLKTVEGWMNSIPPEWCTQSPRANLAFAWMHLMRGNYPQAAPYLQQLQTLFSDSQFVEEDPALEAKWLALQSMLLNGQGKPEESLQRAKQALEIVPQDNGQVLSMIHLGLANAYQQLDDYEQSVGAFQMIIQLGQTAGNSVTELLGISGLALLAIQHGEYHFAFELASQGIERIERSGSLPPISTAVYGELAVIHYQWHQLDQAHHNFRRAIQVGILSGYSDAELFYGVIISRLFQIKGDLESAAQEIQKVVDLMQVEAPAAVREEVLSQQVRIYLAMGNPAEAERILKNEGFSFQDIFSFPDLATFLDRNRSRGVLYLSALRLLLYQAKAMHDMESLKTGIELADHLIDGALQHKYIPFALEALILRAQMHAEMVDIKTSKDDYMQALQMGEPEGFISIFVEGGGQVAEALETLLAENQLGTIQPYYVQEILGAFESSRHTKGTADDLTAQIEPLTDREMDVLRLMAEGLKYEEIANQLYISLNTVRSHVKSIYGKLGVNNRTKAIDMAHQLHLL